MILRTGRTQLMTSKTFFYKLIIIFLNRIESTSIEFLTYVFLKFNLQFPEIIDCTRPALRTILVEGDLIFSSGPFKIDYLVLRTCPRNPLHRSWRLCLKPLFQRFWPNSTKQMIVNFKETETYFAV